MYRSDWSLFHPGPNLVYSTNFRHVLTNSACFFAIYSEDDEGRQREPPLPVPKEKVIDCGEYVWAVAFGSSVSSKCHRTVNVSFHRFNFGKDLILATGLQSGRIKTWDVSTGEKTPCFPLPFSYTLFSMFSSSN